MSYDRNSELLQTEARWHSLLRSPALSAMRCGAYEEEHGKRSLPAAALLRKSESVRAAGLPRCWPCLARLVGADPEAVWILQRAPGDWRGPRPHPRTHRLTVRGPMHGPRCASPYHTPRRPARAAVVITSGLPDPGPRCWPCVALDWVALLAETDTPTLRLHAASPL